ncbi:MAG: restriction endonuclease subunit S [Candidatus Thiodiazotropha taylori]|nr:restriction endonuclease subunit S [Candidatus Thiodiazotropha taylori]
MSSPPDAWVTLKTGEVFWQISTSFKKIKTKECKSEGMFPVIDQGQGKVSGYIDDPDKVINIESPVVVFGDHTRAVKWVDHDFVPGADGTKVLQSKDYLEPRYFYYQIQAIELPNKGYARHFKYLKDSVFLVAPLAEQKQIAAKLDELLAQVDTLKTRLDAIPAILKRFRQSVLAAAVSGRLTEEWRVKNNLGKYNLLKSELQEFRDRPLSQLPKNWQWLSFSDVAEIASNLRDPKKTPDAPHIAPNHIESETGVLLEFATVAEDNVKSAKHQFYAGQILYSKIRPYLAKVVTIDFDGLCSADMYPVNSIINTKYLFYWMLTYRFTEWASNAESRVVLPKINQKDLGLIPTPVPSNEEQVEIVRRIEHLFTFADKIEQRVKNAQTRVNNFTQSILAKAFRGELTADWREQNPDLISGENSAEALLNRIKAQRQSAPLKTRTRKKRA